MSVRFALIGAAGYVAPRHMQAIKAVGGELVASYDPSDSVGVLDKHFEDCEHFTEYERFLSFLETNPVDYVSICSPNHFHEAHCRAALRSGADAICEKPLVVNPGALEHLLVLERHTGKRVWGIQQMRLHAEIQRAKAKYGAQRSVVEVEYITPRGRWYDSSWKASFAKSGGLLLNIGVHLFDVLGFIFGEFVKVDRVCVAERRGFGTIRFERAIADFRLSLNKEDLPEGKNAHRVITINGETFDISEGFTDLHTESYQNILEGNGFGIKDCYQGIEVVAALTQKNMRAVA